MIWSSANDKILKTIASETLLSGKSSQSTDWIFFPFCCLFPTTLEVVGVFISINIYILHSFGDMVLRCWSCFSCSLWMSFLFFFTTLSQYGCCALSLSPSFLSSPPLYLTCWLADGRWVCGMKLYLSSDLTYFAYTPSIFPLHLGNFH